MLEKGKVYIGAWYGVDDSKYDLRHIKEAKECGIDFLFTGDSHDDRSREIIKNCEECGMKLILFDWDYYEKNIDFTAKTVSVSAESAKSPAVIGHAIFDEPGASLYSRINMNMKVYNEAYPDKLAYTNLLPMGPSPEALGADTYEDYVEEFVRNTDTDYISVDIYPLATEDGKRYLQRDYIKNLSVVSDACRRSGREFWCFIQSMPFNIVRRAPSVEDIRFEFYSLLAFGAVKVVHFCYATPPSGAELFPYAMTDIYGEKTPLWYICGRVNSEIHALKRVYEQYKYKGTYTYKTDDVPEYLDFCETADSRGLTALRSDECLLVGCFEHSDSKGYIVTNMSRLEDCADTTVSFEARRAVVYIKGIAHRLDAGKDGRVSFVLESGEGAFVTIA